MSKEFQGNTSETQVLHTGSKGMTRICLLGLGEKKECSLDALLRAYGTATMRLKKMKATSVVYSIRTDAVRGKTNADIVGAVTLGLRISNYHFSTYKTKKKKEVHVLTRATFLVPTIERDYRHAMVRAECIADGLDFAKNVSNAPANHATPVFLAEEAKTLAKRTPGMTVTVFDKARIEKEKMGGLLGVAQGSQHEPRFIILEYNGHHCSKGAHCRPIVLVGKAITFDTGGISLKPWQKMEEMKFDMCGGAATIAIVAIAARLKLPIHVVGLVAAAENMPSHTAYKPGDILTLADGTTVEILSTDAEGRLVVADGLIYAKRYKPRVVVDIATLTGAVVVTLHDYASGLFTPDDALAATLLAMGEETGDRVWRLPIVPEWADSMKSPIADLRQVPSVRIADATIAALFLQNFVEKKTLWAHLDIAGTAWKTDGASYFESGATGASVRLLVRWLETLNG